MPALSLNFDPILLPGQTARLFQSEANFMDVRCVAFGSLAVHRHDFGTISAATLDQDDTHLDMPNGEMGQYRYVARGNFDIHLQHPGGVDQYRTNGSNKANRLESFRMPPWAFDAKESKAMQNVYLRQ